MGPDSTFQPVLSTSLPHLGASLACKRSKCSSPAIYTRLHLRMTPKARQKGSGFGFGGPQSLCSPAAGKSAALNPPWPLGSCARAAGRDPFNCSLCALRSLSRSFHAFCLVISHALTPSTLSAHLLFSTFLPCRMKSFQQQLEKTVRASNTSSNSSRKKLNMILGKSSQAFPSYSQGMCSLMAPYFPMLRMGLHRAPQKPHNMLLHSWRQSIRKPCTVFVPVDSIKKIRKTAT